MKKKLHDRSMKCVIIKSKQELCGSPDGADAEPEGLAALLAGFRMQECVSKHSGYSALLPVLSHEQKTDFGETLGWLQRLELSRALTHETLRMLYSFPRKSTPYSVAQYRKVCNT